MRKQLVPFLLLVILTIAAPASAQYEGGCWNCWNDYSETAQCSAAWPNDAYAYSRCDVVPAPYPFVGATCLFSGASCDMYEPSAALEWKPGGVFVRVKRMAPRARDYYTVLRNESTG
jgi:hypothetical protein